MVYKKKNKWFIKDYFKNYKKKIFYIYGKIFSRIQCPDNYIINISFKNR